MVSPSRIELGRRGEQAAEAFLRKNGYRVLGRRVRTRFGEMDFVAADGDVVCFIEVRSRRGDGAHEKAFASVAAGKQRRLSRLAVFYLKNRGWLERRARFDVVAVDMTEGAGECVLIKDAFPALEIYR